MSEDLMDASDNRLEEEDNTYQVTCELCERVVVYSSSTGEPVDLGESCGDMSCGLLSQGREGGDPEPLDFNDSGC